jgi:hypothetical protein
MNLALILLRLKDSSEVWRTEWVSELEEFVQGAQQTDGEVEDGKELLRFRKNLGTIARPSNIAPIW